MRRFLKKFKNSKSGLAYIWATAFLCIAFWPVIYWALSLFLDNMATTVFANYTFVGSPADAWILVKALISALPVFVLLIVLLWSAVNSKAQAYEQ